MPPLLVFDGECGFCAHCAAFAKARLDPAVAVLPWQAVHLDEVGLTVEQVRSASYWVDADGAFPGETGIARALQAMGAPWSALGRVVAHPLVRPLASRAYAFVARGRRRDCRRRDMNVS